MRAWMAFFLSLGLAVVSGVAQKPVGKTLDIYVVDMEGGNSTLFVAPPGIPR